MINTNEAFELLLSSGICERIVTLPLSSCTGKVLAQDILCDHDLPPFDRVMMDGYAIQFSGLELNSPFQLIGEQRAGAPPISITSPIQCIEVMTGCVLPSGCDTVVAVERSNRQGNLIQFTQDDIKKGQHIHQRARDHISGDVLVSSGTRVHSGIIAIAASCGITHLNVFSISSASILSTGDELVDISTKPESWQIRKSNPFLLASALDVLGIRCSQDHSIDESHDLVRKIECCGHSELLLITGGVSMGKYDLVPGVLSSMGYNILFHKVLQKPGKPFLAAIKNNQLVIAFPGNPVSVMACVSRYLMPLFDDRYRNKCVGVGDLKWTENSLTMLLPVRLRTDTHDQWVADSVPWSGSGDFASLSLAQGFVEIQAGITSLPKTLRYFPIL